MCRTLPAPGREEEKQAQGQSGARVCARTGTPSRPHDLWWGVGRDPEDVKPFHFFTGNGGASGAVSGMALGAGSGPEVVEGQEFPDTSPRSRSTTSNQFESPPLRRPGCGFRSYWPHWTPFGHLRMRCRDRRRWLAREAHARLARLKIRGSFLVALDG